MRRRDLTVRATGLVLTGELAVHELRYLLAPEPRAGHGYLPLVAALSVLILAVAAGQLAGMLERARSAGRDDRVHLSFRAAWIGLALSIVALFCVQEAMECLLTGGSEGPLAAVVGGGGWTAFPLAVAMAALLAMALKGAAAVVCAAARATRAAVRRIRPAVRPSVPLLRAPAGALARNLAGRGPPLLVRS